jgi:hypothetical protein
LWESRDITRRASGLSLTSWRRSTRISRLEVGNWKTNFFNEATISLSGDDFKFYENPLSRFYVVVFLSRVEEWASENFMDNSDAVHLISKDVSKNVVAWRREESIDDLQ